MAFYGDDGKCFWCREEAIIDWCGVPLCDEHWTEEQQQQMLI